MTIDSRERFSATASNYSRYRPSYPPALFDWLAAQARLGPGAVVADVGCGTGIATRLWAARGYAVTGIDPNQEMLAEARREGGARYQRGEATATGLDDASVDLVSAAQAFHWFDVSAALGEFRRVLRPGGACAAFWNLRGAGPLMDEYDALLRAHASEYEVLLKPVQTIAAIRCHAEVSEPRAAEFAHAQRLDRAGLFGRAYSSSYVVHGLRERDRFDRALDALFDRHAVAGTIEFPYACVALLWRLA